MSLILQLLQRPPRPFCRFLLARLLSFAKVTGRLLASCLRRFAFLWDGQLHPSPPCLGQTNRNRLFGGTRAMFTFANVLDLFAHKLAGLRTRRFTFGLIFRGAF